MPPEADSDNDAIGTSYIPVSQFFSERAVFVTGGTGFLGKVLVEKLLRSCPGIKVIYLLMRPKRGLDLSARLSEMTNCPLFDRLKREFPSAVNKLVPIQGDISEPDLGISPSDQDLLARHVSVVFHSAATVRFDEPLKVAVQINLLGTKRVVELCRRMQGLQALVHVSTCYCNCDREEIDEVVYPTPYDYESIVKCTDWMDDELLATLTPKLLGKRPNTYTLTKALTENMLLKEAKGLPLSIVRPTIMSSTWKEPMPGWIEGLNGTTGVIAAYGKGLVWTMICDGEMVGDMIPADIVINLTICAAWRTATDRTDRVMVYNCGSGARKPLKWNDMFKPIQKTVRSQPSEQVLWYPGDKPYHTNMKVHKLKELLLHYFPAYLLDIVARITHKKAIMVRVQNKMSKGFETLAFFTTREWRFLDNNTLELSKSLSKEDGNNFFFDIADIEWYPYMEDYTLGVRRHIHKEHNETIPRSITLMNRLLWIHRATQIVLFLLLLRVRSIRRFLLSFLHQLRRLTRMLPISLFVQ